MEFISKEELTHLIECNNLNCDDEVKINVRNSMIENLKDVKEDEKIFTVTSACRVTITCCEWMAFARHVRRVSSKINATGFKMERIKELANNSLDAELWHHLVACLSSCVTVQLLWASWLKFGIARISPK